MSEPQSDALTTSPQPPYQEQYLLYIFHQIMSRTFLIIFKFSTTYSVLILIPNSLQALLISIFQQLSIFIFSKYQLIGADSKDLNFNKVYMRIHRRSGLLISKFAL